MAISDICKLISQNLSHNLRLAATDDERRQYFTAALAAFGQQVVPPLSLLFTSQGEGSPEFESARTVALELATLICGGLVRSSKDYRSAINSLDECIDKCSEPQIRAKLVFYTNQLKKRWNIAEPGGLPHNPRAKKVRTEYVSRPAYGRYLGGVLILGVVCYLFSALLQPRDNPERAIQSQSEIPQTKAVQEVQRNQSQQAAAPAKAYYTFRDNQGVIHMVDDLDKVPLEFRSSMKVDKVTTTAVSSTPVTIKGNQVVVPVAILFRGRTVAVRLLLDTGASVTTISETVAQELGVSSADVKRLKTTVADGRKVDSYHFKAESLSVSDRALANAEITIIPGSGGKDYDGLLGMNYLKNHRYHVNFENRIIEWGG